MKTTNKTVQSIVVALFISVLTACGSSSSGGDDSGDNGSGDATYGQINLSGTDTADIGTVLNIFSTTDTTTAAGRMVALSALEGLSVRVTFQLGSDALASVFIVDDREGKNFNYLLSCYIDPDECTKAVVDTTAKTVIFNDLILPIISESVNGATADLTLSTTSPVSWE